MSEPGATLPYGSAPPPDTGGSDLKRFIAFMVVAAIVLVALFLLIRGLQERNSASNYQDCLSRVEEQDNAPGFRPEDFCVQPN